MSPTFPVIGHRVRYPLLPAPPPHPCMQRAALRYMGAVVLMGIPLAAWTLAFGVFGLDSAKGHADGHGGAWDPPSEVSCRPQMAPTQYQGPCWPAAAAEAHKWGPSPISIGSWFMDWLSARVKDAVVASRCSHGL